MRVLALDLGSTTGFAVSAPNEREVSGSMFLGSRSDTRCDPEVRDGRMFSRFSTSLTTLIEAHQPDHVVIEGAAPGSQKGRAAPILLGLRGAALIVLERREVPFEEVPPTRWQKWAKRHGWTKGTDANDAKYIARWWVEQQIEGAAA